MGIYVQMKTIRKTPEGEKHGYFLQWENTETKEEKWGEISREEWNWIQEPLAMEECRSRLRSFYSRFGFDIGNEVKNTKIPRLPEGCPPDFPKGYKEKNGKFYKTDDAGNVIELRNLFGHDISDCTTIDLLYGCTKEYCDRVRKSKSKTKTDVGANLR